jgi:hypothetical protein
MTVPTESAEVAMSLFETHDMCIKVKNMSKKTFNWLEPKKTEASNSNIFGLQNASIVYQGVIVYTNSKY